MTSLAIYFHSRTYFPRGFICGKGKLGRPSYDLYIISDSLVTKAWLT